MKEVHTQGFSETGGIAHHAGHTGKCQGRSGGKSMAQSLYGDLVESNGQNRVGTLTFSIV